MVNGLIKFPGMVFLWGGINTKHGFPVFFSHIIGDCIVYRRLFRENPLNVGMGKMRFSKLSASNPKTGRGFRIWGHPISKSPAPLIFFKIWLCNSIRGGSIVEVMCCPRGDGWTVGVLTIFEMVSS